MTMLEGAPWLLAHRSMLEPDEPIKVSLYGKDYVLWQDQNGKITALPNACPHMGAMLSEGWCEPQSDGSSAIACPFHALEFDARGCTIMPGSRQKTLPQMKPLELIIQDDFVWSYGEREAKVPVPNVLNQIAENYSFIGHTADMSVETDLLGMLLNMHDYNHQNGTHRPMFRVENVHFEQFQDSGHQSHAFYDLPTSPTTLWEKVARPDLLLLPKVLKIHLENHFPSLLIFHGETRLGKMAQVHLFLPESATKTRTYVLLYGPAENRMFKAMSNKFLNFAQVIVEQDADILGKIYPNSPQKMKLNNEVGIDWVRRNFQTWPTVAEPNLSR